MKIVLRIKSFFKLTITGVTLLLVNKFTYSQNIGINVSGTSPNSTAIVDISSNEKGILIPRMTNSQRQALKDPATGLIIYNSTSNKCNYYNGSGWYEVPNINVSSGSGAGTASGGNTAINTTGASADPSALLDISSTSKGLLIPRTTQNNVSPTEGLVIYNTATNQIEYYNGTSWNSLCNAFIDNTKGMGASAHGVAINSSGISPNVSAILDISSTNKGLLIPRMTSTERNSIKTPATGLMVYNTTTDRLENWNGSAWFEAQNDDDAPTAPTANAATNVAQTDFDANWTAVPGATTYYLDVATDAGFTSFVTGYNNKSIGNTTSDNVSGLTCGTTYYYRVRAENLCGNSSSSNTRSDATGSCWSCNSALVDARDGKSYTTVQIGSQCWMAQNLDYGTYVTLATGQGGAGTQKYCFNNNTANCATYGGLYEWYEMMNGSSGCNGTGAPPNDECTTPVQGICPAGWHVPSHHEWTTLERNAGSSPLSFPYDETTASVFLGVDEGGNLKQTGLTYWNSPNAGATNSSGYTALGAGSVFSGSFIQLHDVGRWWSSTPKPVGGGIFTRYLWDHDARSYRVNTNPLVAISVRCVQD